MPMATKHGMVVTYLKEVLPLKSQDPIITLANQKYNLHYCNRAIKLVTVVRRSHSKGHMILQSRVLERSHDKLNMLYLNLH